MGSQCNLDTEGKPGIRRVYLSHRTNVNVTALRRKASWQLEAKEYQKSHTAQQTSHKRFIGRRNQDGSCFCLARETTEN